MVAAAPDSLASLGLLPRGIRVTVLDSLGKVLYDSDNDASAMENHIQRPEIEELLGGKSSASSIRTSSTSGTDYIYYARRCGENIVRTAMPFEVAERRFLHPDWLVLLSIFLLFTASLPLFLLISKRFNAEADFKLKKQKKQMTNNIAHELRTPVTSIRAYLETLENNPGLPDEKQRVFIDRAYRQSIRLSDMIRDISLITKMEDAPQSLTTTYLGLRRISELVAEELGPDLEKRSAAIAHLEALIKASAKLGVGMVTTFIGRDQHKTVDENIELFKEIWPPIIKLAEEQGVKVAIENCPMLFGADQWPGGQNLMTTPAIWRKVFEILPSKNLGLNYDPSHFVWQMLDYTKAVYDYRDKMFHIHFKDIKLYPEKLKKCGIMAHPLEYMSPKLPSYGDVKWDEFACALTDIGYEGYAVIEIEDKAFEGCR